jgi:hypothetical protein
MPATASSAPAADRRLEALAVAIVVGAMAAVMFATHRAGHWWGDDWALYLRQARGLVDGHPGRVLAENEFAVQSSRGAAFSPPLYPWGFPLVLAPFVAVVGTDIDRLAIVPVLSACAFACGWYVLARRRIGAAAALLGTVAVTMSPLLLGWTELIQSEWPFLAVTIWSLVAIDHVVSSGGLIGHRWAPLVGIGLMAAASFSVRREGLAVVAAIAAAQLVVVVDRRPRPDPRLLADLAIPHATAGAAVLALQIGLPTTVIPRYSGTSLWNAWRLRHEHVDHLAEIVGLKRPWDAGPMVLGNAVLGRVAVGVFLAAGLLGLVAALTSQRRRDVHVAVYALVAFAIGASFRVAINRYLCTVAPVLILLGATVVVELGRRYGRAAMARTVVAVALTAIVAGDLANAHLRVDRAAEAAAAGTIEWGPTHPDAVAMFDAVTALTAPDDVVAAPKARAMTFATGRLAVQVDRYRPIPDLDLAVIVAETGSPIADQLDESRDRYERVWSNTRFVIYRPG